MILTFLYLCYLCIKCVCAPQTESQRSLVGNAYLLPHSVFHIGMCPWEMESVVELWLLIAGFTLRKNEVLREAGAVFQDPGERSFWNSWKVFPAIASMQVCRGLAGEDMFIPSQGG